MKIPGAWPEPHTRTDRQTGRHAQTQRRSSARGVGGSARTGQRATAEAPAQPQAAPAGGAAEAARRVGGSAAPPCHTAPQHPQRVQPSPALPPRGADELRSGRAGAACKRNAAAARRTRGKGYRRPCCEFCRPSRMRFSSMIRFFMVPFRPRAPAAERSSSAEWPEMKRYGFGSKWYGDRAVPRCVELTVADQPRHRYPLGGAPHEQHGGAGPATIAGRGTGPCAASRAAGRPPPCGQLSQSRFACKAAPGAVSGREAARRSPQGAPKHGPGGRRRGRHPAPRCGASTRPGSTPHGGGWPRAAARGSGRGDGGRGGGAGGADRHVRALCDAV